MSPALWIAAAAIITLAFLAVRAGRTRAGRARGPGRRPPIDLEAAPPDWQSALDAVDSPILVLAADGSVLRLNRSAADLLHAARPAASGWTFDESWTEEPWRTATELAGRARLDRGTASRMVESRRGNRSWEVEATLTPPGDGPDRVIVFIRDITRLVELQQALMRSESTAAMGSLVAGVAHEVRNPLFTISASLDAFEARFGAGSEEARYLSVLRGGVNRLSVLMEQLVDYGKPTPYFPTRASIRDLIGEAADSLEPEARRSGIRIENNAEKDLPPVLVDRGRLVQAFQNLLRNALQAAPGGTTVRVGASLAVEGARSWIECTVEDEGPGIPEEHLSRVFEPFFTRRQGGAGLGLSIVRRIVDQLGGRVLASNGPTGGAILRIRLPLAGAGKVTGDGKQENSGGG